MSQQLKFIASVFKMVIAESNNVMGPETIQTIFRLIGEHQGEAIERRLRLKYKTDNWKPEEFAEHFIKDVVEPALGGDGMASYKINNDEITVTVKVCPFKAANLKISDHLFCTYTEGMIDQAFKKALKNKSEFMTDHLIADRESECVFKITVK
jgi:predicted hydrocarbon binding protein